MLLQVVPVLLKLISNKHADFHLDIDSQTNLVKCLVSLCYKRVYASQLQDANAIGILDHVLKGAMLP